MRHLLRLGDLVVGRRVVVRHRLADGSASDALGDLVSVDAERLVVSTRRGEVVVARADVLAARGVPPPRRTRPAATRAASSPIGVDDLERVMAEHWRPRHRVPLGGWQLRAAGGYTGRANSALAVGSPGVPLDAAVAAVEAFYAGHGLEAVVAVPQHVAVPRHPGAEPRHPGAGPTGPRVDEELDRRGWTVRNPTLVMTAEVAPHLAAPAAALPPGLSVRLDDLPDGSWTAAYRGRGVVPPAGRELLLSADQQVFVSVRDAAGAAVAVARGSLSAVPESDLSGTAVGRWAGLAAVEVDPAHRRRGLARRACTEVLRWAGQQRATWAFVQVAAANTAAVALYEQLGFAVHHGYRYRVAPRRPGPLEHQRWVPRLPRS